MSKLKIWASVTTIAGIVIGLPVSICSIATFEDLLAEYGWSDGAKFPDATVGQFYAISDDGSTREPLCEIKSEDVAPVIGIRPTNGLRVVNALGKILPILPQFATSLGIKSNNTSGYFYELRRIEHQVVFTSSLFYLQKKIFEERDPKKLSGKAQEDAIRFDQCTHAILQRAREYCVTQTFDAIVDSKTGEAIAMDLQPMCIIVEGAESKSVPEIDAPSIWTTTKMRLGLVSVEPIAYQ